MAVRTRYWKVAILWILSLVAVGAISSSAQQPGRGLESIPISSRRCQRSSLATTLVFESSGRETAFRLENWLFVLMDGGLIR